MKLRLKLTHFLFYLLPNLLGSLPVEAYAAGFFLDPHGLDQGGQRVGHPTEHRYVALFGQLDFLPVLLDGFLVLRHHIPINMRMPADQFFAERINHRADVKVAFLSTNLRIKHQVQEQVAHLLFNFLSLPLQDGVRELKRLFNGQVAQAFGGLLFVPGTLCTQLIHDGQ